MIDTGPGNGISVRNNGEIEIAAYKPKPKKDNLKLNMNLVEVSGKFRCDGWAKQLPKQKEG